MREFGVGLAREPRVRLDAGTDRGREALRVGVRGHERDRVRVAHRDRGDGSLVPAIEQLLDAALVRGAGHRNLAAEQARRAHLDRDGLGGAAALDVAHEAARAGVDRDRVLVDAAAVVEVLRDAADAVAAHLGFAAVGVEHAHACIGAWPRAARRARRRRRRRTGGRRARARPRDPGPPRRRRARVAQIDDEEVVAEPVILAEPHPRKLPRARVVARPRQLRWPCG